MSARRTPLLRLLFGLSLAGLVSTTYLGCNSSGTSPSSSSTTSSSAGVPAIGPTSTSLCDAVCQCVGCSKNAKSACVEQFDDSAKAANENGCKSVHDAWLTCLDGQLLCRASTLTIDGCDTEASALTQCTKQPLPSGPDGVSFADACDKAEERIAAKLTSCGVQPTTGGEMKEECTSDVKKKLECYDACFTITSCDVLTVKETDPAKLDAFASCLAACDPTAGTGGSSMAGE